MLDDLNPFVDLESVKPIYIPVQDHFFERNHQFEEVPQVFLQKEDWSVQFAAYLQHAESISILEGRGIIASLKRKPRNARGFGMRHVHLSDNMGMTLALTKSRGRSFKS